MYSFSYYTHFIYIFHRVFPWEQIQLVLWHFYSIIKSSGETYISSLCEKGQSVSTATKQAIDLMEILPESEQNFALEFIKKLVLAWDPDFTTLTPAERASLEEALADSERIPHDTVNWD